MNRNRLSVTEIHSFLASISWWIRLLLLSTVIVTPHAFTQNRVLHVVLTENPGPLLDMTRRSMAVELERAGMAVESREVATVDGLNAEQATSMATAADTQYVAMLRFSNAGARAWFEMALYDGGTGSTLAILTRENVPVELEYDTIVARTTRTLIADAGLTFRSPDSLDLSVPETDGDTGEVPVPSQLPFAPEESPTEREALPVKGSGFVFNIGVAPVFVTGDATDYLKFGFLASLSLGYGFQLRSATLGFDVLGGVGMLYPENAAAGIDVYVAPIGPSVRLESSSAADLRVGVRVSGGPALIAIRNPSQPDLTKLVPYALGGVEVSYQLSRSILIRLESNYTVFFEEVYPIMAFSPTLAIIWQP